MRARLAYWKASLSPKTFETAEGLVRNCVEPHIGNKLLQRLSAADVETWHSTLLTSGRRGGQSGLTPRTVRHSHKLVAKGLEEAVRHGLVVKNVCRFTRPPKLVHEEMKILTAEQVAGLPALLSGHPLAAATLVALFTGMRRGEILALPWGNVDLDGKLIRVRVSLEETQAGLRIKPPKSKAGVRNITLPHILVETLRAQRQRLLEQRLQLGLGKLGDDDLVFPRFDGSPQQPNAFSAEWSRLAAEHGLGITFHGLRHVHASQLIDAGVDVVTIAKRLGHSSPATTLNVYAHLYRRDDGRASAVIDAAFGG
jgi:integrase